MTVSQRQKGFTLIEIMVVVVIIAIIAGLSFFALNQATDRRYTSQAADFQVWLQQLSDMAMLEGSAYGIKLTETGYQALVYYDYTWYQVATPETFSFNDEVSLSLVNADDGQLEQLTLARNNRQILPEIIMLPDGYMEPVQEVALVFVDFTPVFRFRQENNGFNLIMERSL